MSAATTAVRREELHRRGVRLEVFTVAWNAVEAVGAGLVTGGVSLIGFGADSFIEVISAVALLWRLRKVGPNASAEERGDAERRALYLVAATFFLLAAYITYETAGALLSGEGPEDSTVGLVLSVISLLVMPTLAYVRQAAHRSRDGQRGPPGRRRGNLGVLVPLPCAARGCGAQRRLRLVVGRSAGRRGDASRDPVAGVGNSWGSAKGHEA